MSAKKLKRYSHILLNIILEPEVENDLTTTSIVLRVLHKIVLQNQ